METNVAEVCIACRPRLSKQSDMFSDVICSNYFKCGERSLFKRGCAGFSYMPISGELDANHRMLQPQKNRMDSGASSMRSLKSSSLVASTKT
jgi:hypothetical protein